MGGRGSGGARVGAGRKSKRLAEKVLHGTATGADRRAGGVQVEEFDAPDDLTRDERLIWMRLAPQAFRARTLTRGTEEAFSDLCRQRALLAELGKDPDERGGANYRGVAQRVHAMMKDFALSPMGKPLIEAPDKPEDPFAEFESDGNARVQ